MLKIAALRNKLEQCSLRLTQLAGKSMGDYLVGHLSGMGRFQIIC